MLARPHALYSFTRTVQSIPLTGCVPQENTPRTKHVQCQGTGTDSSCTPKVLLQYRCCSSPYKGTDSTAFTCTADLVCGRAARTTFCCSVSINTGKRKEISSHFQWGCLFWKEREKKEKHLIDHKHKSCPFSISGNPRVLEDAETSPSQR